MAGADAAPIVTMLQPRGQPLVHVRLTSTAAELWALLGLVRTAQQQVVPVVRIRVQCGSSLCGWGTLCTALFLLPCLLPIPITPLVN